MWKVQLATSYAKYFTDIGQLRHLDVRGIVYNCIPYKMALWALLTLGTCPAHIPSQRAHRNGSFPAIPPLPLNLKDSQNVT